MKNATTYSQQTLGGSASRRIIGPRSAAGAGLDDISLPESKIRRRLIASALGSAALLPAFGAGAQTPPKVWRIGVLVNSNWERQYGLFRDGMRELGYVEGRNIAFELRTAQGKSDALPALAAELAALKVDAIFALLTPSAHAAKGATSTIPIVIWAGDPVGTGLIASLARPGGNITGMSATGTELGAKNLELIRDLLPATRRVGVLANATDPFTQPFLKLLREAGTTLGIEVLPAMVRSEEDYAAAFAGWQKPRVDAVIHQPSLPMPRSVALLLQHRLPSTSNSRQFAEAGGLMSYQANAKDAARRVAYLLDRILKGAKPADLPVEQPTTYELIINLKTAKALDIKIPYSLSLRASEMIE